MRTILLLQRQSLLAGVSLNYAHSDHSSPAADAFEPAASPWPAAEFGPASAFWPDVWRTAAWLRPSSWWSTFATSHSSSAAGGAVPDLHGLYNTVAGRVFNLHSRTTVCSNSMRALPFSICTAFEAYLSGRRHLNDSPCRVIQILMPLVDRKCPIDKLSAWIGQRGLFLSTL